jgi:hypothetical protein
MERRSGIALGVFLACCVCAFALDPSLEISQYAHTSWPDNEAFGKGAISAIDQTPDGYLWLATEFGLFRFDGVRTAEWQPPAGEHLPSRHIRNPMAARDGTLWIGGSGLVSWKGGKLTHYPELDKHDITAVLQDREGTVWAAGKIWAAGPSQPGKLWTPRFSSKGIFTSTDNAANLRFVADQLMIGPNFLLKIKLPATERSHLSRTATEQAEQASSLPDRVQPQRPGLNRIIPEMTQEVPRVGAHVLLSNQKAAGTTPLYLDNSVEHQQRSGRQTRHLRRMVIHQNAQ